MAITSAPGASTTQTSTPGIAAATASSVDLMGVTKLYGDAAAVRDLDLHVEPSEFLSLLDPSGCGKTTTLRMIGGFEYPTAGRIRIGDAEIAGLPPHKRPTNTVFQAYALFPHMTVAENVAYGLAYSKTPKAQMRERVREALGLVRMDAFAQRRPAQLSGGQQQRVALARALVNRPSVLLLDEPMSALDRKLREEMQIELTLLQQQLGTTFILVTHDQEEAMTMSDRIAVMREGRIEQIATPAQIYDQPVNAYVASFIGQQNFLPGTITAADVVETQGIKIKITEDRQPGERVTLAIRPENLVVSGTGPQTPVDGAFALVATLMDVSVIGASLQIVTSTADGIKLVSRQPRHHSDLPAPGSPVHLSVPSASFHVFTENESETTQ